MFGIGVTDISWFKFLREENITESINFGLLHSGMYGNLTKEIISFLCLKVLLENWGATGDL